MLAWFGSSVRTYIEWQNVENTYIDNAVKGWKFLWLILSETGYYDYMVCCGRKAKAETTQNQSEAQGESAAYIKKVRKLVRLFFFGSSFVFYIRPFLPAYFFVHCIVQKWKIGLKRYVKFCIWSKNINYNKCGESGRLAFPSFWINFVQHGKLPEATYAISK
jgi:hypothetical protein